MRLEFLVLGAVCLPVVKALAVPAVPYHRPYTNTSQIWHASLALTDSPHAFGVASNHSSSGPHESPAGAANDTAHSALSVSPQGNETARASTPRGSLRSVSHATNVLGSNVSEEHSSPFVKITSNVSIRGVHRSESVEATVSEPSTIASTFIIMYVPIIMGWAWYFHHGRQQPHYTLLLPATYCIVQIGQDLVNQSLAVAMKSPMAITLLQGISMMCLCICYTLAVELPQLRGSCRAALFSWVPIACFFSAYQLVNHLVWWRCSLSERTVFANLTPAAMLVFELLLMPAGREPLARFRIKMALFLMVAGAVLFSIQYPNFSWDGFCVAVLMVITTIPYRLSQRYYFASKPDTPIGILCVIDSFVMTTPAWGLSRTHLEHFWPTLFLWFQQPSIVIMLLASIVAFSLHHVCALQMLREGSATSFLVFSNLANFVVVSMSMVFFGDNIVQTPLTIMGLLVSLGSGLWYAVEVQPPGALESVLRVRTKAAVLCGESYNSHG